MTEDRAASGGGEANATLGVAHYRVGRLVVITVTGEVDALTAPQLSAAIGEATVGSPTGVIVDLAEVDFLASAGLRVLIATHDLVAASARFGIVASGPATRRPITALGLDGILPLHRTLEEALADMREA